jgi:hypothetical protein
MGLIRYLRGVLGQIQDVDDQGNGLPINPGSNTFATIFYGMDQANNAVRILPRGDLYEAVAASQTDQVLGVAGAVGDYLEALIILPSATQVNNTFSVKDGSTAIAALANAAGGVAVSSVPIRIDVKMSSVNGGWKITTGSGTILVAIGKFS